MARPPSEAQQTHKGAQDGVTMSLALLLKQVWDALFGDRFDPNAVQQFKDAAFAIVQQHALAAQSIAQEFYNAERSHSGVTGAFRTPLIGLPTPEQVSAAVDKGLAGLTERKADSPILPSDVIENTLTNVGAELELVTVDSGRDLTMAAVQADRHAIGWARIPKPGACAFCMLMSTRAANGFFYKSAETAGKIPASDIFGPDAKGDGNSYHPGCRCQVVPVFSKSWEPPQHVQDAVDLYDRVAADERGHGKATAFRRAYERPHLDEKRSGREAAKRQRHGFSELTPEQLQHQISVLESLPDSDYKTTQLERLNGRLADVA